MGGKGSQTSGKPAIPTLSRDRTRGTSIIKQLFPLFSPHECNLTSVSVGLWRRNDEKQQPAAACKMIYKGGERGERDHWPEEEHGSVAPLFSRARKTRVISTMGGNGEEQISEEAPAPTVN